MFNRFTKDARLTVNAAVEEAGRRADQRVGTEHLLLGLLHDPRGPAGRALGVDLVTARAALHALDVEALASVGVDAPDLASVGAARTKQHRPFTAGAKAVLVQTLREATLRRERRLESRHILLALLACTPPDPAAAMLAQLGLDPVEIRSRLVDQAA